MVPRMTRLALGLLLSVLALWSTACEKSPLLAPSGSTITLSTVTNALAANGSAEIVAQVIESAGTAPHSGTRVSFTTTLGRIEPSIADTDANGRAVVRFIAGTSSGTATISASSGAANTGKDGAIKIAVGAAAVGRISISASPNPLPAIGGTSIVTANVVDINGSALGGVNVNFSTTAGTLTASAVTTDDSGVARTALATAAQATVTANVGGTASTSTGTSTSGSTSTSGQSSASVTINVTPQPTVSITAPSGTITAGSPVVFTLSVSIPSGSSAQVRDVSLDFGDGTSADLGAITGTGLTVQHSFTSGGTFTVRATVIDTQGGTTSAASVVVVLGQPPLSVVINPSLVSSVGGSNYNFTATVIPNTATIASYLWTFGDSTQTTTTSPQTSHLYTPCACSRTVTLTVTTTTGQTTTTSIVIPVA